MRKKVLIRAAILYAAVCIYSLFSVTAEAAPGMVKILPSTTPSAGGAVSFSVTIPYTAGSYAPGTPLTLSVALSPLPMWSTETEAVNYPATGSATVSFTKTYPISPSAAPGSTICFKAMSLEGGMNKVFSDEACVTVKGPSGLPDLAIDTLYLDAACNVVVTVVNNGPGTVPDSVWTDHKPESSSVYLSIDGNKWGGATIWNFDSGKLLKSPGGKATYNSTLHVKNSAKITASVDHTGQVAETNEGNNTKETTLICRDFAAKNLAIKTSPLVPGQPVNFTADVSTNVGGVVSVRWEIDGTTLLEESKLMFGPSTQPSSATWPKAISGNHTVKFIVDSKDAYKEPDETNNTATLSFSVPFIKKIQPKKELKGPAKFPVTPQ